MEKETYCNGSIILPFGRRTDAVEANKITINKFRPFNGTKNILGLPINPGMPDNHLLSPRIEIDNNVKLCLVTTFDYYIDYQRHCLILPVRGDLITCRIPFNRMVIIAGKIPAFVANDIKEGRRLYDIPYHPTGINYGYYSGKLLFLHHIKDYL